MGPGHPVKVKKILPGATPPRCYADSLSGALGARARRRQNPPPGASPRSSRRVQMVGAEPVWAQDWLHQCEHQAGEGTSSRSSPSGAEGSPCSRSRSGRGDEDAAGAAVHTADAPGSAAERGSLVGDRGPQPGGEQVGFTPLTGSVAAAAQGSLGDLEQAYQPMRTPAVHDAWPTPELDRHRRSGHLYLDPVVSSMAPLELRSLA